MKSLGAFGRAVLGVDAIRPLDGPLRRYVIPVVIVVLGAGIALLRIPLSSWNVLWAEDGPIFVTDAYAGDPLVFFESYAGYMHAVPRLLAGFAAVAVPVEYVPLAISALAALVTSGVAAAVYLFARLRITSTLLCCAIALQVVALPIAGSEVLDNLANLHWYLTFGAFWAALVVPATTGLRVLQVTIVILAVLTDPLAAALIAPLMLVRLAVIRPLRSRDHVVTLAYVVALGIQGSISAFAVLVARSRPFEGAFPPFLEFFEIYSERMVFDSLVGVTGTVTIMAAIGRWSLVAVLVLVAGALLVVAWRAPDRRALILTFAAASLGFALLLFALLWRLMIGLPPGVILAAGRYMVVPTLLLVSAYAVCLDALASRLGRRTARVPVVLFVAASVAICAIDFRVHNVRDGALPWNQALEEAVADCERDSGGASAGTGFGEAAIAPTWFAPARIPCDILIPATVRN